MQVYSDINHNKNEFLEVFEYILRTYLFLYRLWKKEYYRSNLCKY